MPAGEKGDSYQVVARRYRPQSFESLVGQHQVAKALSNAIHTNRVGHAYLFTGARGVGKTSTARIFAKCLNCETGPTDTPCGKCEVCLAVNEGQDVDVLEIDGASNRGIDEVRELRANVNVRPSRSRYKIYIIDEVHMLTTQAFNALLKTLEEPPTHVKFIFCTTDPEKIPITVLSRCQRFDFAPVEADSISERLGEICKAEGFEFEPEAMELLARRANGSMRDSQSLLEQLLSFCDQNITLHDVNQLLGTADLGRVKAIADEIIERNSQQALGECAQAIAEGVDCAQLGNQLVGYFRDLLVVQQGCSKDLLLTANPTDFEELQSLSGKVGSETVMASLQIFDAALTRLRTSSHARTLLEMAIIRCCNLENLDAVSTLIDKAKAGLPLVVTHAGGGDSNSSNKKVVTSKQGGDSSSPTKKKENESQEKAEVTASPAETRFDSAAESHSEGEVNSDSDSDSGLEIAQDTSADQAGLLVNQDNVESLFRKSISGLEHIAADYASNFERVEMAGADRIAVKIDSFYKEKCEDPQIKKTLEDAFKNIAQRRFRIDFVVNQTQQKPKSPAMSKRQQMKELEQHPLVRAAITMFDGEILDVRKAR